MSYKDCLHRCDHCSARFQACNLVMKLTLLVEIWALFSSHWPSTHFDFHWQYSL